MKTTRGQILVSRTNDDPLLPPFVCTKRPPCVDSKRPRVYRHHAHMSKHMCAWCRHTRGRFKCTHGGVFESTHDFFTFFSVPQHTHKHTHHDHNDTTTTTPHGDRDRERQRQTETERDRERERETQDETRKEKKREDVRGETRKDREGEREDEKREH